MTTAQGTHDLVHLTARRVPDRPALVDGDTVISYREVDRRARSLAQRLAAHGVRRGTRVAVTVPRSAEHVIATLAVWQAGGICVPVATDLPQARVADMLSIAGVRLIVGPVETVEEITGSSGADPLDDLPDPPSGEDGTVAYIYFTSGSTGRPKAVAVPHTGIINEARWSHDAFAIRPEDRASWLASPGFAISRWELWTPLTAGAAVVISPEGTVWEGSALRDWLVRSGVNWSIVVTGLAERLLSVDWPDPCPLRLLVAGGEQLRVWPEGMPFDVVNSYGVTEASSVRLAAWLDPAAAAPGRLPPVGHPIQDTRVYVLDDELVPVARGQVGELFIGGRGLARGYLGDPEQTAERFLPDPFLGAGHRMYRTGDMARVAADGEVEFAGRRDDDPKVAGVRVDLAAVEAALLAHPGVTAAAATIRTGEADRPRLVGYLVTDHDDMAPDGVIDALAELLPAPMVPHTLVRLAALPLLPSGKTDRKRLPEPAPGNVLRSRRAEARDDTERRVIDVFQEILGIADIGAHDDFFGLGGDSLGVARVRQALLDRHGMDVPYTVIFRQRTPRRICAAARENGDRTQ
ncbi:non-ribosomal peptide synthetase [Streptomyces olindensis]|uniref:Non-ribosomal peptide synthetase n=1 Tax=Streptomyces olindensis TaxID=358823 RepID=A0ABV2Y1S6_9ACTN